MLRNSLNLPDDDSSVVVLRIGRAIFLVERVSFVREQRFQVDQ